MKCLTIMQPWAHLIVHGQKRIENRQWRTAHRGPLLIHTGRSRDGCEAYYRLSVVRHLPDRDALDFSSIVGIVDLVDCRAGSETTPSTPVDRLLKPGRWCWILDNAQAFDEPIPYSGARRVFEVRKHIVKAQLQPC